MHIMSMLKKIFIILTVLFSTLLFQFSFEMFKLIQYIVKCLTHIKACWYKKKLAMRSRWRKNIISYMDGVVYLSIFLCIHVDETSFHKKYICIYLYIFSTKTIKRIRNYSNDNIYETFVCLFFLLEAGFLTYITTRDFWNIIF
jgi:hypothetical protein